MEYYKVYAKVDGAGRILAINSSAFLTDLTGWVEIDEGNTDRYHHAQNNYLGAIMTEHGVPLYKLVDDVIMCRTKAEIEAETPVAEDTPTDAERIAALEAQNEVLLACILEMSEMVYA